jgi:DNA-binding CsgD family transcriptional regulator
MSSPRDDPSHLEIPLLERDREQAVLGTMLAELDAGWPAVVTVRGRPGYGQGALVRWAADHAGQRGLRVLRAQATPAERELRYGALVRLLTPMTALAGRLQQATTDPEGPDPFPGLDRLLCAARSRPTLLAVEDAHWLDRASLRWLQALVRRLPGVPIAVLASLGGIPAEDAGWLGTACPPPVTTTELVLAPLGGSGVAGAVKRVCGITGEPAFTSAAEEVTGGNPAVLRDTLRRFAERGHEPVDARVPELRALAAEVVGDHVTRALLGLPDEVVGLLRAMAVCGDLLDFPLVCALAGPREAPEALLRATLEATGLTTATGSRLRVCGPAVKTRLLEGMPAEERAELYARAAELAHRAAVPDEDLAEILLGARPIGAPWAVHALRRGFAAALRGGEPGRAAGYLTRAFDEPLDPVQRLRLTFELAGAEVETAPEASGRRLGEIARSPGAELGDLRLRAIDLGLAHGGADWVRRATADALPAAEGTERDGLVALFWLADQTWQEDPELMVPEVPALPEHPQAPAAAGVRAWQLAARGEDRDTTRALARAALAGGAGALVLPRLAACRALVLTDDGDEAETRLDALLAEVRRGHARAAAARLLANRAELNLRRGRLDAAQRDLAEAEHTLPPAAWHAFTVPYLIAVRIAVDLESGFRDQARSRASAPTPAGAEDGALWSYLLFARALVACADGRLPEALELCRESGRRLLRRQWDNPALLPWRSVAARTCQLLGRQEPAHRLAREELALAERWGAPGALGWARLTAARVAGDTDLATLRETAHALRDCSARPISVRALLELAMAELAAGEGQAAATLVDEASRLTALQPSSRLGERAARLAERIDPAPGVPWSAWTGLSDAERHAAALAGRGLGNQDIAEMLSVTRRTVELRLSGAYRKLRISGRKELCALVRAMEGC